jgi:oleandomycin transport system ATP-binding protein
MSYAFQAESLVKRFGKTTALAGVDLAASPGTVLGVLGPNGAGKTTVVRVLATLLRPDGGRAMVGGLDVVREARRVRRIIGLTGQYAAVDDDLTGAENLILIGQLLDLRRTEAKARAANLLEQFGLADAAGRRVATYSGGMRRRLDLAASLVGRPAIIFLDEPTSGLDPVRRGDLWRMIGSLTSDGVTVLLTTQHLEEADALADQICIIDQGKVIAHGTPAELKQVVSGRAIAVRPRDPGQLGEVALIIGAVTGHEPGPPARGVVTVPVDGEADFAEVMGRLERAGIGVAELSLRLPSLDEVFFTLTGRRTEVSDDGTEVAS